MSSTPTTLPIFVEIGYNKKGLRTLERNILAANSSTGPTRKLDPSGRALSYIIIRSTYISPDSLLRLRKGRYNPRNGPTLPRTHRYRWDFQGLILVRALLQRL